MDIQANPVSGRLGFVSLNGPLVQVNGGPSNYGISRLGLVPRVERPALPVEHEQAVRYRKVTFKAPAETVARLKAYARVTEQYQYNVATDAVNQFLDRVVAMLGYEERGAMNKLTRQFQQEDTESSSAPVRRQPAISEAEQSPYAEPVAAHSPHWWWILRKLAHPHRGG